MGLSVAALVLLTLRLMGANTPSNDISLLPDVVPQAMRVPTQAGYVPPQVVKLEAVDAVTQESIVYDWGGASASATAGIVIRLELRPGSTMRLWTAWLPTASLAGIELGGVDLTAYPDGHPSRPVPCGNTSAVGAPWSPSGRPSDLSCWTWKMPELGLGDGQGAELGQIRGTASLARDGPYTCAVTAPTRHVACYGSYRPRYVPRPDTWTLLDPPPLPWPGVAPNTSMPVSALPDNLPTMRMVAVTEYFGCGLSEFGGRVYCWGGSGVNTTRSVTGWGNISPTPMPPDLPPSRFITAKAQIACSISVVGSQLQCWGQLRDSGTGLPPPDDDAHLMHLARAGPVNISSVAIGPDMVCAVDFVGKIRCWFSGSAVAFRAVPSNLPPVAAVAVGNAVVCVIFAADRKVRCFTAGECDKEDSTCTTEPPFAAAAIDVDSRTGCMIKLGSNAPHCWRLPGYSAYWPEDTDLQPPSSLKAVSQIAAHSVYPCAVAEGTGQVVCWGDGGRRPDRLPYPAAADALPTYRSPRLLHMALSSLGQCGTAAGSGEMQCWNAKATRAVPLGVTLPPYSTAGSQEGLVSAVGLLMKTKAGQVVRADGATGATQTIQPIAYGGYGREPTDINSPRVDSYDVLGSAHLCAVARANRTVMCAFDPTSFATGCCVEDPPACPVGQCIPPPSVYPVAQVRTARKRYCALLAGSGGVECWGPIDKGVNYVPPGLPPAAQIGQGIDFTCILQAGSGVVHCWGDAAQGSLVGAAAYPFDSRPMTTLSVGGGRLVCALNVSRGVECALLPNTASLPGRVWTQDPPGPIPPAVALFTSDFLACVLDESFQPWCMGWVDAVETKAQDLSVPIKVFHPSAASLSVPGILNQWFLRACAYHPDVASPAPASTPLCDTALGTVQYQQPVPGPGAIMYASNVTALSAYNISWLTGLEQPVDLVIVLPMSGLPALPHPAASGPHFFPVTVCHWAPADDNDCADMTAHRTVAYAVRVPDAPFLLVPWSASLTYGGYLKAQVLAGGQLLPWVRVDNPFTPTLRSVYRSIVQSVLGVEFRSLRPMNSSTRIVSAVDREMPVTATGNGTASTSSPAFSSWKNGIQAAALMSMLQQTADIRLPHLRSGAAVQVLGSGLWSFISDDAGGASGNDGQGPEDEGEEEVPATAETPSCVYMPSLPALHTLETLPGRCTCNGGAEDMVGEGEVPASHILKWTGGTNSSVRFQVPQGMIGLRALALCVWGKLVVMPGFVAVVDLPTLISARVDGDLSQVTRDLHILVRCAGVFRAAPPGPTRLFTSTLANVTTGVYTSGPLPLRSGARFSPGLPSARLFLLVGSTSVRCWTSVGDSLGLTPSLALNTNPPSPCMDWSGWDMRQGADDGILATPSLAALGPEVEIVAPLTVPSAIQSAQAKLGLWDVSGMVIVTDVLMDSEDMLEEGEGDPSGEEPPLSQYRSVRITGSIASLSHAESPGLRNGKSPIAVKGAFLPSMTELAIAKITGWADGSSGLIGYPPSDYPLFVWLTVARDVRPPRPASPGDTFIIRTSANSIILHDDSDDSYIFLEDNEEGRAVAAAWHAHTHAPSAVRSEGRARALQGAIFIRQHVCADPVVQSDRTTITCTTPVSFRVDTYRVTVEIAGLNLPVADPFLSLACAPGFTVSSAGTTLPLCIPCTGAAMAEGSVSCSGGVAPARSSPGWYNLAVHFFVPASPEELSNNISVVWDMDLYLSQCPLGRQDTYSGVCMVPCEPPEACAGGNACAAGYVNGPRHYRCAFCAPGYHKDSSGACASCKRTQVVLMSYALVLLLVILATLYILRKSHVEFSIAPLLVDFWHMISIVQPAPGGGRGPVLPEEIRPLFDFARLVAANVETLDPECYIQPLPDVFILRFFVTISLPAVLLFLAALPALPTCFRLLRAPKGSEAREKAIAQLKEKTMPVRAFLRALQFLYFILVTTILSVWNCVPSNPPDPAGQLFLAALPYEQCDSSDPSSVQAWLISFALPALVVYVFGIPALMTAVFLVQGERITADQKARAAGLRVEAIADEHVRLLRATVSPLYSSYRPGKHWFALFNLLRKALVCLLVLGFNKAPTLQLLGALVGLATGLTVTAWARPLLVPAWVAQKRNEGRWSALLVDRNNLQGGLLGSAILVVSFCAIYFSLAPGTAPSVYYPKAGVAIVLSVTIIASSAVALGTLALLYDIHLQVQSGAAEPPAWIRACCLCGRGKEVLGKTGGKRAVGLGGDGEGDANVRVQEFGGVLPPHHTKNSEATPPVAASAFTSTGASRLTPSTAASVSHSMAQPSVAAVAAVGAVAGGVGGSLSSVAAPAAARTAVLNPLNDAPAPTRPSRVPVPSPPHVLRSPGPGTLHSRLDRVLELQRVESSVGGTTAEGREDAEEGQAEELAAARRRWGQGEDGKLPLPPAMSMGSPPHFFGAEGRPFVTPLLMPAGLVRGMHDRPGRSAPSPSPSSLPPTLLGSLPPAASAPPSPALYVGSKASGEGRGLRLPEAFDRPSLSATVMATTAAAAPTGPSAAVLLEAQGGAQGAAGEGGEEEAGQGMVDVDVTASEGRSEEGK